MIVVDQLWPHYLKSQDYTRLAEFGITVSKTGHEVRNNPHTFIVGWGDTIHQSRSAAIETGFFWDGIHIDSIGLYEKAAFNFPQARAEVSDFDAPESFRSLQNRGLTRSKFRQSTERVEWDGVVVVAQHPGDRSIWKAGSTGDYHRFLDEACAYYGAKAFVKLHPVVMGNKEELEIVRNIAARHGSHCGHVDLSILDKAESVLVYNSTFVVDAIAAEKNVVQYAPGYFWQSGVVQYSERNVRQFRGSSDASFREKFLDFLVWKYCFHKLTPMEGLADIVKAFASSKSLFPLPVELSYAAHMLRTHAQD